MMYTIKPEQVPVVVFWFFVVSAGLRGVAGLAQDHLEYLAADPVCIEQRIDSAPAAGVVMPCGLAAGSQAAQES